VAKQPQPTNLPEFQGRSKVRKEVDTTPKVKTLLADTMLATDFDHGLARFCFPQYPQNLFFRESPLTNPDVLLSLFREPRRLETLNFKMAEFLGFGSV
jgi:hypothetical protein